MCHISRSLRVLPLVSRTETEFSGGRLLAVRKCEPDYAISMRPISSAIRSTVTPDGAILLDVERGQMFSVNGIGSIILQLLSKGFDEARIVAELSTACGADVNRVRPDVREFLELLGQHHILEDRVQPRTRGKEK